MNYKITDVARRAGVSPATVSRVLSGDPRIREENLAKVKQVLEEVSYQPNMVARSLVTRMTGSIAVVLPQTAEATCSKYLYMELLRGIVKQTKDSGYEVLLSSGGTEAEEAAAVTRLVKGGGIDGVILLCSRKDDAVVQLLRDADYPFVLAGRSNRYDDILTVHTDQVKAAYEATGHLISLGHTRIGFISGPAEWVATADLLEGYRRAMTNSGLPVYREWVMEGKLLHSSGYRAMAVMMSLPNRPTALVAADDILSFGLLRGLKELNFKVPDDMALVSLNNFPLAELSSPPISSMDTDLYFQGYTAAQVLIHSLHTKGSRKHKDGQTIIPHRLVVRASSIRYGIQK